MTDRTQDRSPQNAALHSTLVLVAIIFATAVVLKLLGRVVWCKCGGWSPWSWDIWSMHNSQHLIDPYFFSHVLHGIVLYGVLHVCWKGGTVAHKFHLAIVVEAAWEILENSPIIINRYREVTISLDYFGDSIANSTFDILACAVGFLLAAKLKPAHTIAIFVLSEVVMLVAIRDNLTLNVVMLVCPIDAIREWQMGK